MITVLLLVAGGLATPVTGLLIRPDSTGARHGLEMFVYLGRWIWYGYVAVSVVAVVVGVLGVLAGTEAGRWRARVSAGGLRALTVLFGAVHVLFVANGAFGDRLDRDQPLLAVVSGLVAVAAVLTLLRVRVRLRRA
jgi:hypothetical protein